MTRVRSEMVCFFCVQVYERKSHLKGQRERYLFFLFFHLFLFVVVSMRRTLCRGQKWGEEKAEMNSEFNLIKAWGLGFFLSLSLSLLTLLLLPAVLTVSSTKFWRRNYVWSDADVSSQPRISGQAPQDHSRPSYNNGRAIGIVSSTRASTSISYVRERSHMWI